MSNYSPIVSYGPKDSLSHGDPNKLIKGVQIDNELNAIAAAIVTKYDASNLPPAIGTVAAQYLTASIGGVSGWGPALGALRDLTPDTATFTANYTGFTGTVQAAATYFRVGRLVVLYLTQITGTSNAVTFTLNNLPAIITPGIVFDVPVSSVSLLDNGASLAAASLTANASFSGSNTITFFKSNASNTWTASGTKGVGRGIQLAYAVS